MNHKLKEWLIAPFTMPVAALSTFILLFATFFVHIGLAIMPAFLIPLVLSPLLALRLIGKDAAKAEYRLAKAEKELAKKL